MPDACKKVGDRSGRLKNWQYRSWRKLCQHYFFDIDGTILSEITHKIPESALEALHKAQENGHKTFINTGRTICSVPPMIKRISFDGFLCGCGTHLIYGEQVVFHHSIPYERGREIIKSMKDCKVEGFLEGTEDIYYSNRISRLEPVESSRRYMAGLGLGREQAMEDTGYDFDKILIYIDKMADGERFFKETEDVFNHIDRLGGVYECVQKEYSKATAIEYIQKELHLADDEIYAFGDSSNDLDMIKAAGHGVIMGHHDPVLEPYAEYITDTVENDGLYKAMEHYGLI